MTSRTRMNVYFSSDLLKQVEGLALRRNVSKSAVIEAAVASFLSGDTTERLEAAMSRRLDKLGRQFDMLDEDVALLQIFLMVAKRISCASFTRVWR